MESTVDNINSTVLSINSTITDIESNVSNINTLVTTIDSTVNTIESTVNRIEANVSNINTLVTTIDSTVNNIDANITEIQTKVDTINSTVNTIDSTVNVIDSTTTNTNTIVNETQSTINQINSTVNNIDTTTTNIDSKVDTIDSKIDNINSILENINSTVTDTNTIVNNIDTTVTQINSTVENIQSDIEYINSILEVIEGKVDIIDSTVTYINTTTTEIDSTINIINSTVNKIWNLSVGKVTLDVGVGAEYNPGDTAVITLTTTDGQNNLVNSTVNIKVYYPNGTLFNNGEAELRSEGRFNYSFVLLSEPLGTYTIDIDANYSGNSVFRNLVFNLETTTGSGSAYPIIELKAATPIATSTTTSIGALIKSATGMPTNCDEDLTITIKDIISGSVEVPSANMTNFGTGMYNYSWETPTNPSIFYINASCSISETAYTGYTIVSTQSITAPEAIIDYNQIATYVWNYSTRDLTYYNQSVAENIELCLKDGQCSDWWIDTTLSNINNTLNIINTSTTDLILDTQILLDYFDCTQSNEICTKLQNIENNATDIQTRVYTLNMTQIPNLQAEIENIYIDTQWLYSNVATQTNITDILNGINDLQSNIVYIKNNMFTQGNATEGSFIVDYLSTAYADSEIAERIELWVYTKDLLGNAKTPSAATCGIWKGWEGGSFVGNATNVTINSEGIYAYWNISNSSGGNYNWDCTITGSTIGLYVPFFISGPKFAITSLTSSSPKYPNENAIVEATFATQGGSVFPDTIDMTIWKPNYLTIWKTADKNDFNIKNNNILYWTEMIEENPTTGTYYVQMNANYNGITDSKTTQFRIATGGPYMVVLQCPSSSNVGENLNCNVIIQDEGEAATESTCDVWVDTDGDTAIDATEPQTQFSKKTQPLDNITQSVDINVPSSHPTGNYVTRVSCSYANSKQPDSTASDSLVFTETTVADDSSVPIILNSTTPITRIDATVPDIVINVNTLPTVISGDDKTITLANKLTINAPTTIGTIKVEIPSNIEIIGKNSTWPGTIIAPTLKTVVAATPTPTSGNDISIGKIIEIGTNEKLILSKAVRLLIPGQAGKLVGYSVGGNFFKITTTCTDDTQTTNDLLPDVGDCKIDYGSDLVIWTKHFTQFITYTETPTPQITTPTQSSGGSGGGGGGGGIVSRVIAPTEGETSTEKEKQQETKNILKEVVRDIIKDAKLSEEFSLETAEINQILKIENEVERLTPQKIEKSLELAREPEARIAIENLLNIIEETNQIIEPTSKLEVYEVIDKKTGEKISLSKIDKSFKVEKNTKKIELIEVIPESMAETTDEIHFIIIKNPGIIPKILQKDTGETLKVLQKDPVVKYVFRDLKKGEIVHISYIIKNKKIEEIESITLIGEVADEPILETSLKIPTIPDISERLVLFVLIGILLVLGGILWKKRTFTRKIQKHEKTKTIILRERKEKQGRTFKQFLHAYLGLFKTYKEKTKELYLKELERKHEIKQKQREQQLENKTLLNEEKLKELKRKNIKQKLHNFLRFFRLYKTPEELKEERKLKELKIKQKQKEQKLKTFQKTREEKAKKRELKLKLQHKKQRVRNFFHSLGLYKTPEELKEEKKLKELQLKQEQREQRLEVLQKTREEKERQRIIQERIKQRKQKFHNFLYFFRLYKTPGEKHKEELLLKREQKLEEGKRTLEKKEKEREKQLEIEEEQKEQALKIKQEKQRLLILKKQSIFREKERQRIRRERKEKILRILHTFKLYKPPEEKEQERKEKLRILREKQKLQKEIFNQKELEFKQKLKEKEKKQELKLLKEEREEKLKELKRKKKRERREERNKAIKKFFQNINFFKKTKNKEEISNKSNIIENIIQKERSKRKIELQKLKICELNRQIKAYKQEKVRINIPPDNPLLELGKSAASESIGFTAKIARATLGNRNFENIYNITKRTPAGIILEKLENIRNGHKRQKNSYKF
ncbi:MAG: hypothetical protein KKG75_02620 [Nanoarchaeota archaeon]|nr:hypothetical protein [Nanoarchaeota archaeon]